MTRKDLDVLDVDLAQQNGSLESFILRRLGFTSCNVTFQVMGMVHISSGHLMEIRIIQGG
jgi:hypothetical protein